MCIFRCKINNCVCRVSLAPMLVFLAEAIACFVIFGMNVSSNSTLMTQACTYILIGILVVGCVDIVSFFMTSCAYGNLIIGLIGFGINILIRIFSFVNVVTIVSGDNALNDDSNTTCTDDPGYDMARGMTIAICVLMIFPLSMMITLIKGIATNDPKTIQMIV